MPFIRNIHVTVTEDPARPTNSIQEINGKNPDINAGFGGKYVWLFAEETDHHFEGASLIVIMITEDAIPGAIDLAAGAGGKYRYLHVLQDPSMSQKIAKVALYRNESAVTQEEAENMGFNRVSNDINEGRSGDYLYLLYNVE